MKKQTPPLPIDQIRKRLGQNIAAARKNKEWMQAELAEKVGMDPVSLSRIETGNSLPGIERVIEIAAALDVGTMQLLEGVSLNLSDQAQEVATCMARLSASDRNLVVSLVRQLTERLAKK